MVRREASGVRRYAAFLSLGAPSLEMGAKLKNDDQAGVRAVFALDPRLQQDTLPIGDFPLVEGQRVEFSVMNRDKGLQAEDVIAALPRR